MLGPREEAPVLDGTGWARIPAASLMLPAVCRAAQGREPPSSSSPLSCSTAIGCSLRVQCGVGGRLQNPKSEVALLSQHGTEVRATGLRDALPQGHGKRSVSKDLSLTRPRVKLTLVYLSKDAASLGRQAQAEVSKRRSIMSPTCSTRYLIYLSVFLVKGTLPYLCRKAA